MKIPKIITVLDAINLVKSNDNIVIGMAGAEPREFIKRLHERANEISGVTVTIVYHLKMANFFINPIYKSSFSTDSWFYGPSLRKAHINGNISFIPNHLHLAGRKRFSHTRPNIFVGTATPPDKHGFLSLSLSNVYEQEAIALADIVVLEVNPNFPRTFGDVEIHQSKIDYIVEVNYDVPVLPDIEPNEKDLKNWQLYS